MISTEESSVNLREHRKWLVSAHHQASQDFDRAVMTLSAGALGLSIAFMRDIAGPNPTAVLLLALAWLLLGMSLLVILGSFMTSQEGLLREIKAVDADEALATPGGFFGWATSWLNRCAAGCLILGVLLLAAFAFENI